LVHNRRKIVEMLRISAISAGIGAWSAGFPSEVSICFDIAPTMAESDGNAARDDPGAALG
jgi:hypothetical protein